LAPYAPLSRSSGAIIGLRDSASESRDNG